MKTTSNNNIYTQRILSILKEKKTVILFRLKELIKELKGDSNGDANLQACLDDLVASKKIFTSTNRKMNGQLVKVYHINPPKNCNASNVSEIVSNRNADNADDHNDKSSDCDFISLTNSSNDDSSDQEEPVVPEAATTPQQQTSKAWYIALTDIIVSDNFRCRVQEDEGTVDDYTEVLTGYREARERDESLQYPFPPAWIWYEDGQAYLLAGFHRYKAAIKAKYKKLLVKEFKGSREEAILFGIKDNLKNALRMNYGDWKHCIGKALILFRDKTPGAIAKEIGCHRSYAYRIEKELSTSRQLPKVEERVGADNKKRPVRRNAKKSNVAPPSEPAKKPAVAPPTGALPEAPDSIPKSELPDDKREATTKPPKPTLQDAPDNNAPFEPPTPATPVENIEPSSPELERKTNSIINYIRSTLSEWGKERDDRRYILHRIKEYIKDIREEEADKTTPSNGETDSA